MDRETCGRNQKLWTLQAHEAHNELINILICIDTGRTEKTMNKSYWNRLIRFLSVPIQITCCGSVLLCAGVCRSDTLSGDMEKDIAYEEMKLLTDAMVLVKKEYVEEKEYKEIIDGAINGMLKSLDQHCGFLDIDDYQAMQDDTSGSFFGIGIHVGIRDGAFIVVAPIEGTPAFRAGIEAGDKIVKIDGEETQGKDLMDLVKILRGPEKGKVVVTIMRHGEEESRDITLIREEIKIPGVKGAKIIKDDIGYIRITRFAETTEEMLQEALNNLMGQGMNALVLDLRNNPGGLLSAAVGVAQKFLSKRKLIVTTKGRPGVHDKVESKAMGEYHYVDLPMAVLVNGNTASASEIVAGALQDHKRAILVGTRTFGKGSVQSIIPLSSDAEKAIRLTTAFYYTPNGEQISGKGIMPDIEEQVTVEEQRKIFIKKAHEEHPEIFSDDEKQMHTNVVDRQLMRAVDILHGINIFSGSAGQSL